MGRQANIARNMWQGAQCHAPRTGNVVRKQIQPVRFDSIGPCHMPMGFANQYDMGQWDETLLKQSVIWDDCGRFMIELF
jgi:hypothetical protein